MKYTDVVEYDKRSAPVSRKVSLDDQMNQFSLITSLLEQISGPNKHGYKGLNSDGVATYEKRDLPLKVYRLD